METENAVKHLGGRSDHKLADFRQDPAYTRNPNEYDGNPRANTKQTEEESILQLKLLSEVSHENEVINSSQTSNNNSFAQSVTKKLSLLFEPSPAISGNQFSKAKTSALNKDLAEIVSEFAPHVDRLKPFAQTLQDIENSKEFRELTKVLDVCYRPYFWAVAQTSEKMMSLIQDIQTELDIFEQNKNEYEASSKQNNQQFTKLSAEKQTTVDEIRIVASALEQSKAVASEFETKLVELEIDGDQLRSVAFAVDELQNLNKDAQSVKKSLQSLEDRMSRINNAINKVKFEATNFTVSLYEYEQNDFDFDDLLVKLKHFPVTLGLISISIDCKILPTFECEDLFGILDSHRFSEEVARRYLAGLLERAHEYMAIVKSTESRLLEDLANIEQKITNHPLKHYRIFQSKLLSSAFNLLRSVDDAENATASFETRLGSLNQKLEKISQLLSNLSQQMNIPHSMLILKEYEDYVLAKIDELNRIGANLVICDLQEKQTGHWIVCWIMMVRKFKIEKLLRTFARLQKLAASDRSIKNVASIWSKALAFQSNMRSLVKSVPFKALTENSVLSWDDGISDQINEMTKYLRKKYEASSVNFSHSLVRPSFVSSMAKSKTDGYTLRQSQMNHGDASEEFVTVIPVFSKKFILHPSVRDPKHLRFFGLMRFLLNGVEVYWRRLNGELFDTVSPKKPHGQSGLSSAKKESKNPQSNSKQLKEKVSANTRHFNPFLAKQYPPESCGYSKCIFLLDLASDAFNFIEDGRHNYIATHNTLTSSKVTQQISDSTHNQTQRKHMTKRQKVSCLPLAYFWKPLVSVNTEDYLNYLQKQGKLGHSDDQDDFMEISLSNVKYHRIDLIAKSVPLFSLLYEFLRMQATDPKIYQALKSKILVDL